MNRSEAGKLGAIKTTEIMKQRRLKVIEEYNKNPKLCEECNNTIAFSKKGSNQYCSRSCSAKNSNRARNSTRAVNKNKKYTCVGCHAEIIITKHARKFCSLICQQSYQRKKAMDEKTASSHSIRTFLIKKYGPACMDCGWNRENPFTKKVPIELEHIDGNSENNLLENLKLLCPNCHSLTSTYKGANKGKGRHARRQRYTEGKSY